MMDCATVAKDGLLMKPAEPAQRQEPAQRREGAKNLDVLDITVLMGGPSAEREVSLMSGRAIAAALARGGHKVTCADISPADASALDRRGVDVVFIALHGAFGESGEVQRLCEQRRLRYTGSDPQASRLAMDKAAAKQVARRVGVPTPDWFIAERHHAPSQVAQAMPELGLPVVLKPVDGGSSLDVTIARTEPARDRALRELLDRYGRAMAERFVPGRELTVGILGAEPLPVLEIIPVREFYDYTAKYADGAGTRYTFEHGLPERVVRGLQAAAGAAHRAIGCRHMSRVDFILDGRGTPWLLEINTIPGFTGHSLLPMAAARAGIGFDELVERIARMALAP